MIRRWLRLATGRNVGQTAQPMALVGWICCYLVLVTACQPISATRASTIRPPLASIEPPRIGPMAMHGGTLGNLWSIESLAQRTYGAGTLQIEQTLDVSAAFTRTLIHYESDGLRIYGFMNMPPGDGPHPVVIVNHGYIDPSIYSTLTYTTRYADGLARAGYIAIHPNYRNYPPSDFGPNDYRAGFAIDVLNLVALVRSLGGKPGPLASADPDAIGLWGHSMGGGVSLRALTVDPNIDAAVLYGAMSGDEARNHTRIRYLSGGARGLWSDADRPSDGDLRLISPIFHLDRIATPISLHHGELDDQVPPAWSTELCTLLQTQEKRVECFQYSGMPHTFAGDGDTQFMARILDFYDQHLKQSRE